MHRDRGYWGDVSALIGRRRGALALGLGLLGACTRANPAYRIVAQQDDAAGEDNPPPPVADAAVTPDLAPPADLASLDLPAPQDRFAAAEAALPADLGPDLEPDSGVSSAGLVAHWPLD